MQHTFDPAKTPQVLKRYENQSDWKLPAVASKYSRISTDRDTAELHDLEWVTPGHPLFEALRRHSWSLAQEISRRARALFTRTQRPSRLDFYRARIVDGLSNVIHGTIVGFRTYQRWRKGFARAASTPRLHTGPCTPNDASRGDTTGNHETLDAKALKPFLDEVSAERLPELNRVAEHIELSLTELLQKTDEEIGRASNDVEQKIAGAEGRLAQAENRHAELLDRRDKRRQELQRQRALTLQSVLASRAC